MENKCDVCAMVNKICGDAELGHSRIYKGGGKEAEIVKARHLLVNLLRLVGTVNLCHYHSQSVSNLIRLETSTTELYRANMTLQNIASILHYADHSVVIRALEHQTLMPEVYRLLNWFMTE